MCESSEHIFFERLKRALVGDRRVVEGAGFHPAAVLVPVVFRAASPRLIFTKRTMRVATHKGQISFPGGGREPGDRSATDTALREAREEIGLDENRVRVAGLLDDLATMSGFVITPVVGIVDSGVFFVPDPVEVAEVFEVALEDLANPEAHGLITDEYLGKVYEYHRYNVDGRVIWGATAGIVFNLLTLLGRQ